MMSKYVLLMAFLAQAAAAGETGDQGGFPGWLHAPARWRMGWEVLAVQPTGALNGFSGSTGIGLSAISERELGKWNSVQAVFSYVNYDKSTLAGTPQASHGKASLQSVAGMANFVHRFHAGSDQGLFALAGLGFRNFWGSAPLPAGTTVEGLGGNPVLGEQRYSYGTGIKLAGQVGVGYDLNDRWRACVRYQLSRSRGHALPTLEAGIGVRF